MSLTNDQIQEKIAKVAELLREAPPQFDPKNPDRIGEARRQQDARRMREEMIFIIGLQLLAGVLQNLNDIALYCRTQTPSRPQLSTVEGDARDSQ